MKKIYKITAILAAFLCLTQVSQAQEQSLRDRIAARQAQQQGGGQQNSNVPKLSVRAEMMNQSQTQDLSNATWIREIYRYVDLKKGNNGALMFPVQPIGNRMNLYTMIFKLMGEGLLTGYNFNRGENFEENAVENFGDVLERLEIPFQKTGDVYLYDEFSIPSNEALAYYVKEAWYFDESNSVLDVKTVAICPVLFREQYMDDLDFASAGSGPVTREPQFWIPYEQIRPYAARIHIMTSDKNNVMNKTIDDFFRLRLYDGEIYKAANMENKTLYDNYKTPEALKTAQEKIEGELKEFEEKLWVTNDSTVVNADKRAKSKKTKPAKVSKPKGSSSGATYSARDRRN